MQKWILIKLTLLTAMVIGCQAEFGIDPEALSLSSRNDLLTGDTPAADVLLEIGDINDYDEIETEVGDIVALCNNRPQQRMKQTIRFDPPGQTCEWGANGNLDVRDLFLQARIEQQVKLDIPSGSVPCGLVLDFPDQQFRYDDHFMFSLNRAVLASSFDFTGILESDSNGILKYDWGKIRGSVWTPALERAYCPIADGNPDMTCSFPGHDQQGPLEIELGAPQVVSAMSAGVPIGGHYFQIITIGDNDPLDCEHTGFSFEVTVSYVQ